MPRTASLLLITLIAAACQPQAEPTEEPTESAEAAAPAPDAGSPETKIANATSAAPASIAANAAVVEIGADGMMMELRAGTNGWTCMPDMPSSPGPDPMCLDANFMAWADAWMKHETPRLSGIGLGYMLQGGSDASNDDPFATGPAPGEQWVETGPHVMVAPADPRALETLPTDYTTGAPYVMWRGTPYAHIMMPVR
jgi:hypothetical protein